MNTVLWLNLDLMTGYLSDLGRRQAIHMDVHLLHLLLHLAKVARRQTLWLRFLECFPLPESTQQNYAEVLWITGRYHENLWTSEFIWNLSASLTSLSLSVGSVCSGACLSFAEEPPQRNGQAVVTTIVFIHDISSLNIVTVDWWSVKNRNKLCLCCTLQWTSMVTGSSTLIDCKFC